MKKILAIIFLGILSFSLFACEFPDNGTTDPIEPPTLNLTRPYESASFFSDGIAEATLATCIDGDTTRFNVSNANISVRYLGIDAPESTSEFEPWGKAASDFVCDILQEAETIVLEAEYPDEKDGFGRHLGYVWVLMPGETEFENLNLLVILNGYSRSYTSSDTSMYHSQFRQAQLYAQQEGLKLFGEDDPLFAEVYDIPSLAYLLANLEAYMYRPLNITVTVTQAASGTTARVGDYVGDSNAIQLYYGHITPLPFVLSSVGNEVALYEVVAVYFHGTLQLVNFDRFSAECLNCE